MFNLSRLIRKRFVVLLLLPLLLGGVAFYYTRMYITPEYSSSATVVVRGISRNEADMRYEDVLASQALAKMVAGVAQSREIAGEVSRTLDDPAITTESLMDSVTVTVTPDSSIVSITCFDADAVRAAKAANQYIYTLVAEMPEYYDGVLLTPLDRAVAPDYPGKPSIVFNTLAAVLAGMAAALIWAYVSDYYAHHR